MPGFRCCNREMLGDGTPQVRLPSNTITVLIRDELPGLSRKEFTSRVMEAWEMWGEKLNIVVKLHDDPATRPTQIVTAHDFGDGQYGILADQELPFGKQAGWIQRIDLPSVKLSRRDFVEMECHEHGHLLGLQHSNPTDGIADLMDPVLQEATYGPQDGDVMMALKLGYSRAGEKKPPPDNSNRGRFIKLEETDENGGLWVCSGYFKRAG